MQTGIEPFENASRMHDPILHQHIHPHLTHLHHSTVIVHMPKAIVSSDGEILADKQRGLSYQSRSSCI
jgi:hypothetical protein